MIPDLTGVSVYLTAFDETAAVAKYLICKNVFAESKYFVVSIDEADSSFDVTLISDTEIFVSGIEESNGRIVSMRISRRRCPLPSITFYFEQNHLYFTKWRLCRVFESS